QAEWFAVRMHLCKLRMFLEHMGEVRAQQHKGAFVEFHESFADHTGGFSFNKVNELVFRMIMPGSSQSERLPFEHVAVVRRRIDQSVGRYRHYSKVYILRARLSCTIRQGFLKNSR